MNIAIIDADLIGRKKASFPQLGMYEVIRLLQRTRQ